MKTHGKKFRAAAAKVAPDGMRSRKTSGVPRSGAPRFTPVLRLSADTV